jgi:hypothetical protein
MTLADLWKYVKGNDVYVIEPDGKQVAAFDAHKYMNRVVRTIRSMESKTYVYLEQ